MVPYKHNMSKIHMTWYSEQLNNNIQCFPLKKHNFDNTPMVQQILQFNKLNYIQRVLLTYWLWKILIQVIKYNISKNGKNMVIYYYYSVIAKPGKSNIYLQFKYV